MKLFWVLFFLFQPHLFSSVIYDFSYDTAIGPYRFSYQAPDFLRAGPNGTVSIPGASLPDCNLGSATGEICTGVLFSEGQLPTGLETVAVTLYFASLFDPGDPSNHGQVSANFPGASLGAPGVFNAYLGGATFTVQPEDPDSAPEPASLSLLSASGLVLILTRLLKRPLRSDLLRYAQLPFRTHQAHL